MGEAGLSSRKVDILILGAGWTSTFLIPLLRENDVSFAATTTTGHDVEGQKTIPFKFDPESNDTSPYEGLPPADTVLVTFPLTGHGQAKTITSLYRHVHGTSNGWIQLGATSIYKSDAGWSNESSDYDHSNPRGIAEDELISCAKGCVLDLAGLYGGARQPKNWLTRVAKTKEECRKKGALHLIHGADVAKAVLAVHRTGDKVFGKRWIIMDLRVYDWYDLFMTWGAEAKENARVTMGEEQAEKLDYVRWIGELMIDEDIKALPRDSEKLGRRLDGRAFWNTVGKWPGAGRAA